MEHPQLPWASFFAQYRTHAFPGRKVIQILLLRFPPKYAMDALPPFYRSVMQLWFPLSRHVDNGEIFIDGTKSSCALTSLTTRFVYDILSCEERTQHRCVDKYRAWGFIIDWQQVWLNLHLWRFIHTVRDTLWLVAHGILPTANRLCPFGTVVDPKCHCGQDESLHLFVQCRVATQLLAWYLAIYKRYSPSATYPTPSKVLVGYGKGVKIPPVFPCLLGLIKHQLWLARNRAHFDHVVLHHRSILSKV